MLAVAFGLLLAASATPPARRNILYLIAGEDFSPLPLLAPRCPSPPSHPTTVAPQTTSGPR